MSVRQLPGSRVRDASVRRTRLRRSHLGPLDDMGKTIHKTAQFGFRCNTNEYIHECNTNEYI